MPIQYTRTFIMICEVEIHLINRFNVTSDSNSFTCDYVTPDDKTDLAWKSFIHSFQRSHAGVNGPTSYTENHVGSITNSL